MTDSHFSCLGIFCLHAAQKQPESDSKHAKTRNCGDDIEIKPDNHCGYVCAGKEAEQNQNRVTC